MKKLLGLLLIISTTGFSQVYVSMGAVNNGVQVGVGALAANVDIQLRYQRPIFNIQSPTVTSFTIGRMINITGNEEDNFTVTPSIGYAHLKRKDFTRYNSEDKITNVELFKAVYGLEVGKDWFMGRASITYSYSDKSYVGATIRFFFNR